MWWRGKKIKKTHTWQDTVTDKVLQGCQWLQNKWAAILSRKTGRWNGRAKRIFLALVIVVLGGHSMYILVKTLTSPGARPLPIQDVMKEPVIRPVLQHPDKPFFTRTDTLKIRQFRRLLDSLRTTETGRRKYDEFISRHPGLLDSLERAEKMMLQPLPF